MGTSASSNGPSSGVSFDPPWLDDIDIPESEPASTDVQHPLEQNQPDSNDDIQIPPMIAPPARFKAARTDLGRYLKSGNTDALRRSLGHYSRTGMGGAKNVANRMRVSAAVGSGLFRALQLVRDGGNQTLSELFSKLKQEGADAYQFIDAIVDSVCPKGGSVDEESCQASVYTALSDFLDKNPNADIEKLDDDNLWVITTSFLGHEAFGRVQLDIGKVFEKDQVPLLLRISRLKEMRECIEAEISAQINKLRSSSDTQASHSLQGIMKLSIENTFRYFEVIV